MYTHTPDRTPPTTQTHSGTSLTPPPTNPYIHPTTTLNTAAPQRPVPAHRAAAAHRAAGRGAKGPAAAVAGAEAGHPERDGVVRGLRGGAPQLPQAHGRRAGVRLHVPAGLHPLRPHLRAPRPGQRCAVFVGWLVCLVWTCMYTTHMHFSAHFIWGWTPRAAGATHP